MAHQSGEKQESNEKAWYCLSTATCFLIGGLVLFNIGCFLNPNIIDSLWKHLDFRLCPWWYFVMLLLIVAFSIKRFLRIFKRGTSHVGGRSLYYYMFYLFWVSVAILVILRVEFDRTTYFSGSTIEIRTVPPGDYEYLLHLPPGYTDFGNPRPLIVFLHGAGTTNKGLDHLKKCDLWHFAKGHIEVKDFPFIIVSPMTPRHGWEPLSVKRLLEQLVHDHSRRYRIDPNRIYLTGFSMGGFGTFHTACAYPEMFAAIAPVAGGGEPEQAEKLKAVPTWAFHGDKDEVVLYESSKTMIDAMKEEGHNEAQLTTLHGAGHGIVGDVYRNPELYRWMLMHKKISVLDHAR